MIIEICAHEVWTALTPTTLSRAEVVLEELCILPWSSRMVLQSSRMMGTLELLRHHPRACALQPGLPPSNVQVGSTWPGKSTKALLSQVRQGIILHISGTWGWAG